MSDINIKMCFSDHLGEIQNLSKEITEVSDAIGHDENLNSFALGGKSKVQGKNAVAMGLNCEANGKASHAEGSETIASGVASHAEGAKYESNRNTESAGQASHAEGASTYAKADGSHAEGILNIAGRFSDEISTAAQELGISGTPQELVAKLLGYGAHAEGMNNKALGSCSHAEGQATNALANSTHAEGDTTIAFGEASHAEGYNTQAKGNQSHAEGSSTIATGNSAHAEGVSTVAAGSFSHAEGSHTEAIGRDSHAEGVYNQAIGIASHVEGEHNIAKNQAQHVSGKYATIDESGNAIFQVGAGTDENNRKDVLKISTDGSIEIQDTEGKPFILQEKLGNLQSQIDGEISTWFYPSSPHNDNTGLDETNKPPLSEWLNTEDYTKSDLRTYTLKEGHTNHLIDHLGDVYVDSSNHTDLPTSMWEFGDVSIDESSIGNEYSPCKVQSTQKFRLKELLPVSIGAVFTVPTPWNITLVYFDSNGKFNGQSKTYSIAQSAVVEDLGAYCSIVIKHPASNNSMPEGLALNPTAGQAWRWCDITSSTDHESVVSAITVQYTKDGSSITKRLHWHKIADSDAVKALLAANENKDRLKNVESSISTLSGGINDVSNRLKDKVDTSRFNDKLEEISEELLAKANQSNLDQLEEDLRRDIEALGSGAGGGVNDVSLFAMAYGETMCDNVFLKAPAGMIKDTDKVIFARYIRNKTRPRVNGRTDKTKYRTIYKGWIRPRICSIHENYPLWMGDSSLVLSPRRLNEGGYDYFYIQDINGDDLIEILYNRSKDVLGKLCPKVVDKKLGIKIVRDGKTIVDYLPFTIKTIGNSIPRFGRV